MTTIQDESKSEKLSEIEELAKLNKLFANRYTDEDPKYIQMARSSSNIPPIVSDWRSRSENNYQNRCHYHSRDRSHHENRNKHRQNRNHLYANYRRDRSRSSLNYCGSRR